MSILDNYKNLDPDYVPNNQEREILPKRVVYQEGPPYPLYNNLNEIIGYCWNTGDRFIFKYSADKIIHVEKNAIIYYETGEVPDEDTQGSLYQRAYNIADLKCWICKSSDQMIYKWEEVIPFSYPINGKAVEIECSQLSRDITCSLNIKNFRGETVFNIDFDDPANIELDIDENLSALLKAGNWRFDFELISPTSRILRNSYLITITDDPIKPIVYPATYMN